MSHSTHPSPALTRRLACLAGALLLSACGKEAEVATPPAAAAAKAGVSSDADKVLNVYNWSDYIDPETVKNFEAKYGIKVNYDVFDSNEVVETKLLAGNTGYDLVLPSAQFMERQIKAGVFQKLDKSLLKNLGNMDPAIMQRVALHDADNDYAVPYMWGTDGIGYNVGKIKEIMPGAPVDSWALVLDPKYAAKFKDCGISILDAASDIRSIVLIYLGKDPNSQDAGDLKLVEEQLLKIRPYVRKVNSSQYIEDLANGDLCIAVGYSGDVLQARDRAREAGKGVQIAYSLPKEGSIIWFDMMVIPADAKHPRNAHLFIDYLMQPEVAAANANAVHYPNGNLASEPFIKAEVKNDPSVFPSAEVKAKLSPELAVGDDYNRQLTRTWTRFQTGH
ncbi:polyamine ABC transporter substrate-binding protein [Candidatus Accumulibacter sp. ACC003]|uniref:polyamine ABC transporter substrate-binding protein n=1 Tax=Candidatus Accumulibacter sp. ACC003 TaxID=2823334 RepID=UPI0025B9DA6B|nr:polyamine ABC transporter substrate-binding protein [Candidatus Accumulibacter sp. ACC003]